MTDEMYDFTDDLAALVHASIDAVGKDTKYELIGRFHSHILVTMKDSLLIVFDQPDLNLNAPTDLGSYLKSKNWSSCGGISILVTENNNKMPYLTVSTKIQKDPNSLRKHLNKLGFLLVEYKNRMFYDIPDKLPADYNGHDRIARREN